MCVYEYVCVRACVCVCVCVRETERQRERVKVFVCEKECVYVCLFERERERECVCVCVCVCACCPNCKYQSAGNKAKQQCKKQIFHYLPCSLCCFRLIWHTLVVRCSDVDLLASVRCRRESSPLWRNWRSLRSRRRAWTLNVSFPTLCRLSLVCVVSHRRHVCFLRRSFKSA